MERVFFGGKATVHQHSNTSVQVKNNSVIKHGISKIILPQNYKGKSPILPNDIYTISIIGTLLKPKISRYAM